MGSQDSPTVCRPKQHQACGLISYQECWRQRRGSYFQNKWLWHSQKHKLAGCQLLFCVRTLGLCFPTCSSWKAAPPPCFWGQKENFRGAAAPKVLLLSELLVFTFQNLKNSGGIPPAFPPAPGVPVDSKLGDVHGAGGGRAASSLDTQGQACAQLGGTGFPWSLLQFLRSYNAYRALRHHVGEQPLLLSQCGLPACVGEGALPTFSLRSLGHDTKHSLWFLIPIKV